MAEATSPDSSAPSKHKSGTPAHLPGGESGYEPYYPTNVTTDSSVKRFISSFYEVSDSPDKTDEWLSFFDDEATVMIGNDVAKGKKEIRKLRRQMWRDVEGRKHRLVKVFPASFSGVASLNEAEFMLFGAVAYRMKDGGDAAAGWAGHAQLRRDGVAKPWRFVYYRVYLQK
ncbi:hypothetical protein VTK56DRAFT_5739 [Thermocarpiscus australiensis]